MPRVIAQILESVVYLYPTVAEARGGKAAGGTGFFTSVPGDDSVASFEHLYVATAGHVIRRGKAPVVRVNTACGVEYLDLALDAWVLHPDGTDLAIAPLGAVGSDETIPRVVQAFYLTEDDLAMVGGTHPKVGPGDECFFVGRFITHDGRVQNHPTVRFGNLAMLPGEPIRDDESGLNQESFLVEARSLSGYSGSPVFVYNSAGMDPDGRISPFIETNVRFLGVDWCHLHTWERVMQEDRTPSEPKQWVRQHTGMAGVIPAWKLTELLNEEEVVAMRKEREAQRKKQRLESAGGVTLDSAATSDFDRFADLTRKLVQVPKKEVDEQRRREGEKD